MGTGTGSGTGSSGKVMVGAPTTARSGLDGEPVALGTAHDLTLVGQRGKTLVQGFVAHATQRAQFSDRHGTLRFADRGGDALVRMRSINPTLPRLASR